MAWWLWIVLGAVFLIAEVAISADFWLVFFGVAALVTGILILVGPAQPAYLQWIVFAGIAVLMLWLYRSRFREKLSRPDRPMGPELVGEVATVKAPLPAGSRGKVELRGTVWDARNGGETELAEGSRCIVEGVDGLTLTVRPE